MSFGKNFIKRLPDEYDMAIDEGLLVLQVRVRKGTDCADSLREWIKSVNNGELRSETKC